jgi:hypothetical protein
LLGYKFAPPEQSQKDTVERYINTAFIDSLRQTLKDGGFSNTTNGVESAGEFLVGYRGRLFRICGDYQVGELLVNFDSVGCGAPYALGALHATVGQPAAERLSIAMKAAEACSVGVRAPFLTESL